MKNVVDLVKTNDPSGIEAIKELQDLCIQTDDNESLFNLAIQYKNKNLIDFLLDDKKCVEFAPSMDASARKIAGFIASEISDIEDAENAIKNACGDATCWQRTPLLQACRLGDSATIQKLIIKGAKLDVKDTLGYSPAELCLETGGMELFQHFLEQCIQNKRKFSISDTILYGTIGSTALLSKIMDFCKLNIDAKRLIFSLACANLDVEQVKSLIDKGFVPAKMVTDFTNPIFEACTSSKILDLKLPNYESLAHLYSKQSFSNTHSSSTVVSKAALDEQLEKRISIINILIDNGITPSQTEAHCGLGFLESIALLGEISLLLELEKLGFEMGLNDEDDLEYLISQLQDEGHTDIVAWLQNRNSIPSSPPSSGFKAILGNATSWDLGNEKVVKVRTVPNQPKTTEQTIIQASFIDGYGKTENLDLFINLSGADNQSAWQALFLVEELVQNDDGMCLLDHNEDDAKSSPYIATYERAVLLKAGTIEVQIKATNSKNEEVFMLTDFQLEVN